MRVRTVLWYRSICREECDWALYANVYEGEVEDKVGGIVMLAACRVCVARGACGKDVGGNGTVPQIFFQHKRQKLKF